MFEFKFQRALVSAALTAAALGIGPAAGPVQAGCNDIPTQSNSTWSGYKGTIDTVFGRPDAPSSATIDPRHIWMGSNSCNPTQLVDKNYVVTVIFKPHKGGPRNIVALTAASDCSALSCDRGGKFHCVPKMNSDLEVFPGTDNKLRFRFPSPDAFEKPLPSQRFTGPALIAVTPSTDPLPCKLAKQSCQDPKGPENLFACVDELFEAGSCSDLDPTFPHFTALPPMNDWQKACDDSQGKQPPCTNVADEFQFTVDKAGNALLPISWAGIVAAKNGKPCKENREVEGRTRFSKTKGGSTPVVLPDSTFLDSFTPRGATWPSRPQFEARTEGGWLVLSGETDVCESVLRISRRNCVNKASGAYRRESCTSDADCKSNETCGPTQFDFGDRQKGGVGPVTIPKKDFKGKAKDYKPKP